MEVIGATDIYLIDPETGEKTDVVGISGFKGIFTMPDGRKFDDLAFSFANFATTVEFTLKELSPAMLRLIGPLDDLHQSTHQTISTNSGKPCRIPLSRYR